MNKQGQEDTAADADCESENVYKGKYFVLENVPKGDDEVVVQHYYGVLRSIGFKLNATP